MCPFVHFPVPAPCKILVCTLCEGDISGGDKSKKGVKRKKISEESGETAKRRSARVRNTKCKKEEKVDFQELLMKFLPSRYCAHFFRFAKTSKYKTAAYITNNASPSIAAPSSGRLLVFP